MEDRSLCDYQVSPNTYSPVLSGILSNAKVSAAVNNGRHWQEGVGVDAL